MTNKTFKEFLTESSNSISYRIINSKGIRSDAYKMAVDSIPNLVHQLTHNGNSKEVSSIKENLTDYFLGRQFSEKLPFGRNAPKPGESTQRKHWDKVGITFQTVNVHDDSARLKFTMTFLRHPNGEAAPFRDSETGDIVLVASL